ncbi:MAG TPA: hypothetical protein VH092_29635, partial [Urbifossiella sp.]|nr:hypothetical protein [Urbifossiella sp.]
MIPSAAPTFPTDILDRVAGFESALAGDPDADLASHLPPGDHPLHLVVLGELVRIDLAHARPSSRPRRLADYRGRFPTLFETPSVLRAVAREEYRQRRQRGEPVSPKEYESAYRIDTSDWATEADEEDGPPTLRGGKTPPPLDATNRVQVRPVADLPAATNRLPVQPAVPGAGDAPTAGIGRPVDPARADAFPEVGTRFLGFRLVEELGRG